MFLVGRDRDQAQLRRVPSSSRQTRIGRGQNAFTIVKFRTMVADAEERKAEVEHLNEHRRARRRPHVQDHRRSPRHAGREVLAKDLDRRVSAALERAAWRDEPGGPEAADPSRAQVRERLGPTATRLDTRSDRPVAGVRTQRGDVLADARARLPVRHQLEPLGRHHADPAHRPGAARQDPRRVFRRASGCCRRFPTRAGARCTPRRSSHRRAAPRGSEPAGCRRRWPRLAPRPAPARPRQRRAQP